MQPAPATSGPAPSTAASATRTAARANLSAAIRDCGRPATRGHGFDYAPFDVDELRFAVASQQYLESRVALPLERSAMTEPVPNRMRRIEMGARNPARRQQLRWPRECVCWRSSLGRTWRVRTVGAFPVRRRDRLKDLDAPDTADENPMRVCRQDQAHRAVAWGEQRLSDAAPQCGDNGCVAAANANIDLQSSKPEIEENGRPILGA